MICNGNDRLVCSSKSRNTTADRDGSSGVCSSALAGDTTTDITAAGAAAVTTLSAATGIGSANALDTTGTTLVATNSGQIGRESCRGRGEISVVAVSLKKKKREANTECLKYCTVRK